MPLARAMTLTLNITRLRVDKDKPKRWFKGNWGRGVVVAHEILVTSPVAKFLFSVLGPFGALGFGPVFSRIVKKDRIPNIFGF